MASQCYRCGKQYTFVERIKNWNAIHCDQCLQHIHQVVKHWINVLEYEFPKNGVSQQLERRIVGELTHQNIPTNYGEQVVRRLRYLRTVSEISWGNISPIRTRILLETDEQAYFEVSATYQKKVKAWMTLDGVFTDLIDEYRFFVLPFIMERGRRFFPDGTQETKLRLVESKMLSFEAFALTYQPDNK